MTPRWAAPLIHRPTVFALIACIGVIGSNSLVLGPIAPQVAASLAVDVRAVVAGTAAYGAATALAAIFLARFIDRYSAKRMLLIAFGMLSAALAASAAAPAAAALVAAQALAGCAAGIALPAVYSFAAAVSPKGRESETMGLVLTGWMLSLVAGVSLSSVIADLLHWRSVYVPLSGIALLTLVPLSLAAPRDGRGPEASASPSPLTALTIPGVGRLLLVCAAYMTAFYGVYAYLGDHIHREFGLSVTAAGVATLSYGIGFGAAAAFDGIIDRAGPRSAMPFAYIALATVYALLALASGSYPAMLAVAFLWGLINHFGLNVLILRLTALDPARRGAILGLNSATTYLAAFVGTLSFGALYPISGFILLPVVAALLCLAAAVATWQPISIISRGDREKVPPTKG